MKTLQNAPRVLLTLFTMSLIALVSVGCGNSREDFVATNTNNINNPTTGNLVFRLQKAVAPQTLVPADTTNVRIDLYSTNPPTEASLVSTQTFPFAAVITVTEVAPNVVSATVTALNGDVLPTSLFTVPIQVILGGNSEVDTGTAVPVIFSALAATPNPVNLALSPFGVNPTDQQQLALTGTLNGTNFQFPINSQAVSFIVADTSVANVSASGLVSATGNFLNGANTTATANYTFLGTTQTDTITILRRVFFVVNNAPSSIEQGSNYNGGYASLFRDSSNITVNVGNSLTYALETPVTGVTIDSDTGVISTTNSATLGEFNVIATFVDNTRPGASGQTFTATIGFTVIVSI